eukprot:577003-Pelagomonas_calceolata.AAC.9
MHISRGEYGDRVFALGPRRVRTPHPTCLPALLSTCYHCSLRPCGATWVRANLGVAKEHLIKVAGQQE